MYERYKMHANLLILFLKSVLKRYGMRCGLDIWLMIGMCKAPLNMEMYLQVL
jgi:hypothetical protein